tara:strand:- start:1193 stop:1912 length:720 start_codon:yes stop_codon:yes gene_type:complete
MTNKIVIFKKIKFYNYCFEKILQKINKGGYLVAPAASALINIETNKNYYNALINSNIAILDSGFLCILLRLFKNKDVTKLSGYLFLKKFLDLEFKKKTSFLLVNPTKEDSKQNLIFLNKRNIYNIISYVAPIYKKNNISDKKLLKLIVKSKPNYIIINLGGEIQESLALYLRDNISFKTSILCTGAAIAFLTKRQAPINEFIDKYYLGWLFRVIYNPKKNFIRMFRSILLIKYFIFNKN